MDVRPRRILHVIDSLGISGGSEMQLVMNLQRFTDPRFSHELLHLYTHTFEAGHADVPDRVRVRSLYPLGVRKSRPHTVWKMARVVGENRPDLMHCSLRDSSLATRLVGRLRGIPVVESLVNISHEPIRQIDNPAIKPWKLRIHRLLDRLTIGWVTRFHALSEAAGESWHRTVGIPSSKIVVIPRGVDLTDLDQRAFEGPTRTELLGQLGLPLDSFVLLNVGRQVPQKGHRYALEAMPRILDAEPRAVLLVVGRPGSTSPMLDGLVSRLGLDGVVRFLGARTDVPALLEAADVFVFTSLFEGFGTALLEAMGRGLSSVAFDRPPMSAHITHGKTGLLVPAGDPEALADAIGELVGNPSLRDSLGKAARRYVSGLPSSQEVARRLEGLYAEVLGISQPDPSGRPDRSGPPSEGQILGQAVESGELRDDHGRLEA